MLINLSGIFIKPGILFHNVPLGTCIITPLKVGHLKEIGGCYSIIIIQCPPKVLEQNLTI